MSGVIDHGTHYIGRELTDYVEGRHFTSLVEDVKQCKREKRYDDAIAILKRVCGHRQRTQGRS
jgi:hypothetical protein